MGGVGRSDVLTSQQKLVLIGSIGLFLN